MDSWHELRILFSGGDLPAAAWPFLLGAARALGFLLALPAWSSRLLPLRLRWAFAALLVFLMARPGPTGAATWPDPVAAVLLLLGEGFLGVALSWGTLIVLAAAKAAGSFISDQIGLSLGGAMDPLGESSEPALRGFLAFFAIHTFLS